MLNFLYFIHVLYRGSLPILGFVLQDGVHDKGTQSQAFYYITQWIFGIIIIALLTMTVAKSPSVRKALITLFIGPVLSLFYIALTNGNYQDFFIISFIFEGATVLLSLIFSFFIYPMTMGIRKKMILNFLLSIPLVGLFLVGFYNCFTSETWKALVESEYQLIGICVGVLVSAILFLKILGKTEMKSGSAKDQNMMMLPMMLCQFAWFFRSPIIDAIQ